MTAGNFIQWKGTDVCIDLRCDCGHTPHFDGYFLYYWKCANCGQVWEMASEVPMKKVDEGNPQVTQEPEKDWYEKSMGVEQGLTHPPADQPSEAKP